MWRRTPWLFGFGTQDGCGAASGRDGGRSREVVEAIVAPQESARQSDEHYRADCEKA